MWRSSERPNPLLPGPDEVSDKAAGEGQNGEENLFRAGRDEQEGPAKERQRGRQGIEPHSKRARRVRLEFAQTDHSADLADELHQNSHGDQSIYNGLQ